MKRNNKDINEQMKEWNEIRIQKKKTNEQATALEMKEQRRLVNHWRIIVHWSHWIWVVMIGYNKDNNKQWNLIKQ